MSETVTLPETNNEFAPENRPFNDPKGNESSILWGRNLAVSFREGTCLFGHF